MDFFSCNIRLLRKTRNLTQTELAKELHISHQAISKWEKGLSIPDSEMLTIIARYFGVSVDQLLNNEIRYYPPPVFTEPPVWPLDKDDPEPQIPRTKNSLGVLFLIPMFAMLIAILILPLINTLRLALTKFNVLEMPKFIGIENYVNLFSKDEVFHVALKNTLMITLFVTLIVSTLTFAISWLIRSVHNAVRYTVVLLFDLISMFVLAGGFTFLFSGDTYGFLNSRLMESGKIAEPIQYLTDPSYMLTVEILLICLILFGPMLTVLSLIKKRKVSENNFLRLLLPLEHSLQVYIAGGLPILLIPVCWNTMVSTFGFPSTNYATHTIIDHLMDHGSVQFNVGYASAISTISLFWTTTFLFSFFVLSCATMHLVAFIKREISSAGNTSVIHIAKNKKITAYILSGVLVLCALFLLFPLFVLLMNSFKELNEIFVFPPKILPNKFSTQNYANLFENMWSFRFSKWLFNMLIVPLLPAMAVAAVSGVSAYGVSYFDYKARRLLYALILLSFVLLPTAFLPDYANSSLANHPLPLAFYAAFFSAAPLIGFVYLKSVIEQARQHDRNPIAAMSLNCIPVVLATYVMCFINPFVNGFMYSAPSFTMYFFWVQSGGTARIGTDSAAKIILTGITFGFLLLAAVAAMVFFPRKKKRIDNYDGVRNLRDN